MSLVSLLLRDLIQETRQVSSISKACIIFGKSFRENVRQKNLGFDRGSVFIEAQTMQRQISEKMGKYFYYNWRQSSMAL